MSSQGNVAARIDGETILASYENEANMVYFTNKSGGSLATGAVVVVDSANDKSFKTTTTQDDQAVLGAIPQLDDVNGAAADQTIAKLAAGYVQFAGFISKLNVQGNVTRGNYLRCSTTAGRAEDAGSTPTKGSFAIAVTGYAGGGAGQVSAVLLPGAALNPTTAPARATMWHDESTVTVGNGLANGIDTSQLYNAIAYQNPSADGDTITNNFFIAGGSYTLSVLGVTDASRGKIDWYIDNVLVVSGQDWYSAANTKNIIKTASVTVTGNGQHTLKGVINGKNASSTSYGMVLTKMWLR